MPDASTCVSWPGQLHAAGDVRLTGQVNVVFQGLDTVALSVPTNDCVRDMQVQDNLFDSR